MKKLWQNKIVWVSSVALFVFLPLFYFLCSGDSRVTLDKFLGVWKTTAANYEDRFIEITTSTIAFGIGDGKQDIYHIQAVTKVVEDKKNLYTLTFENIEETDFKLSFYYNQNSGGVIRFKNQSDIEWTRDK